MAGLSECQLQSSDLQVIMLPHSPMNISVCAHLHIQKHKILAPHSYRQDLFLSAFLYLMLILTHLLSVTSPAIPGSCLMFVAATIPSPLPSLVAAEATIDGVVTETVDLVVIVILL